MGWLFAGGSPPGLCAGRKPTRGVRVNTRTIALVALIIAVIVLLLLVL